MRARQVWAPSCKLFSEVSYNQQDKLMEGGRSRFCTRVLELKIMLYHGFRLWRCTGAMWAIMEITQFNNLTSNNTPYFQISDLALVHEERVRMSLEDITRLLLCSFFTYNFLIFIHYCGNRYQPLFHWKSMF